MSIRVYDVHVGGGEVHVPQFPCRGQRTILWSFCLFMGSSVWTQVSGFMKKVPLRVAPSLYWNLIFFIFTQKCNWFFAIIMYYVMLLNSFICSQSYFWKIPWDFQGTQSCSLNIDTDYVFLLNASLLVPPYFRWSTDSQWRKTCLLCSQFSGEASVFPLQVWQQL